MIYFEKPRNDHLNDYDLPEKPVLTFFFPFVFFSLLICNIYLSFQISVINNLPQQHNPQIYKFSFANEMLSSFLFILIFFSVALLSFMIFKRITGLLRRQYTTKEREKWEKNKQNNILLSNGNGN